MMTFKEFYLQSSKGNKAPPRARRSFKTHKMPDQDFGSDREAEGSEVSIPRWLVSTSTTKPAMSAFPP